MSDPKMVVPVEAIKEWIPRYDNDKDRLVAAVLARLIVSHERPETVQSLPVTDEMIERVALVVEQSEDGLMAQVAPDWVRQSPIDRELIRAALEGGEGDDT
jgi:hypothetical protein